MESKREKYRKLYEEQGWKIAEIARRFRVSESTVRNALTYDEKQKSKGNH